jgi:hypothetical protein
MTISSDFDVKISLPMKDKLSELRLAILESQLSDLYESVSVSTSYAGDDSSISCVIHFENRSDQVHWLLMRDQLLSEPLQYLNSITITSHLTQGVLSTNYEF